MEDGKLVRVLKALADPTRFRMVQEIAAAGELSCGQLGERFPLSQPTISHHIKILADAGILIVRREAQHSFVSVDGALVDRVFRTLPARLGSKKRPRRGRTGPAGRPG